MSSVTNDLDVTVATRWRNDLRGVPENEEDSEAKQHWRTRVNHYRATKEVLDDPTIPFTRQEIVALVRVRSADARMGNGDSTFYTIVGPRAPRSLLRAYQASKDSHAGSVAAVYGRYSIFEQMASETKVWRYCEHRRGWLRQLSAVTDLTRRDAAACLVRVLVDWAVSERALASSLSFSPPMSAVEDLLVIWRAPTAAEDAEKLLRDVIELALGPLGATADGVPRAVMSRLDQHLQPSGRPAGDPDPVSALSEAAFDAIHEIRALPAETRTGVRDEAVMVLTDAIAELRDQAVAHG